jgi:hypothetical protein
VLQSLRKVPTKVFCDVVRVKWSRHATRRYRWTLQEAGYRNGNAVE